MIFLLGDQQLVIFGGYSTTEETEEPCVLNDVQIFDTVTQRWLPSETLNTVLADGVSPPLARHSHLSAITADRLFILGGQDLKNVWVDDIYAYDLHGRGWIQRFVSPRHCGTYSSVAVCGEEIVRAPGNDPPRSSAVRGDITGPSSSRARTHRPRLSHSSARSSPESSFLSLTPGNRSPPLSALPDEMPAQSQTQLSYSVTPTEDSPCSVHLYSNYNVSSRLTSAPQCSRYF